MVQKKKENIADGDNFTVLCIESMEMACPLMDLSEATAQAIELKGHDIDHTFVVAQVILEAEKSINVKPYGEV